MDAFDLSPRVAGLRDLFAEAAEHRRKGDLAAANVVELAALLAVRTIVADARREVRA
jgi:hypothetical protein